MAVFSALVFLFIIFPGVYSEKVTPVPIPNTVVKGLSGDGTIHKSMGE